jgi:hypothetical protein
VLDLRMRLGAAFAALDPATEDLTLALRDDDEVYAVTIPAGTLQEVGPGSFRWNDATGSVGGIRSVRLDRGPNGRTRFHLRTVPLALAGAEFVDHFIEVSLRAGSAEIVTAPLWRSSDGPLKTRS